MSLWEPLSIVMMIKIFTQIFLYSDNLLHPSSGNQVCIHNHSMYLTICHLYIAFITVSHAPRFAPTFYAEFFFTFATPIDVTIRVLHLVGTVRFETIVTTSTVSRSFFVFVIKAFTLSVIKAFYTTFRFALSTCFDTFLAEDITRSFTVTHRARFKR